MKTEELFFTQELEKVEIRLSDAACEKLFRFINLLLEENKTTNLTAITDYEEALIKHLFDSLSIINLPEFQSAGRILDLGSGAGIPSLPLAICQPDKQFESLDSTRKKIEFQQKAGRDMQIENHFPMWGRAEEFGQLPDYRGQYDLVLARAVSAANTLAELTIPFAKVNGFTFFYKGKDYQPELYSAENALLILGGVVSRIIHTGLPLNYGSRTLIIIQKIKQTPSKYPRPNGIPHKKPL
jgi:16S rRNA (guanine527-N7)-methyltransferase